MVVLVGPPVQRPHIMSSSLLSFLLHGQELRDNASAGSIRAAEKNLEFHEIPNNAYISLEIPVSPRKRSRARERILSGIYYIGYACVYVL